MSKIATSAPGCRFPYWVAAHSGVKPLRGERLCSCSGRRWRARASLGALMAVPSNFGTVDLLKVWLRYINTAMNSAGARMHGQGAINPIVRLAANGNACSNILYIDILKADGKRRAAAKATSTVPASPSW